MTTIELYIDNQLCDIENTGNFSVYLKRQLLNPAELSSKDAQRSYDITLPASTVNNRIFGHTNTEEVSGKFSDIYDAILYIGGVKIFDGKFKLTQITDSSYTGNLGIPAMKTAKDVFEEKKMNETGEWIIPFSDVRDMTKYNKKEHDPKLGKLPPCIFPLVLYGLLPKRIDNGVYSAKNRFDHTVQLSQNDFPPSINCIYLLEHLFRDAGYSLGGTALADERLNKLYVSYMNPNDYPMDWGISSMRLTGAWENVIGGAGTEKKYESKASTAQADTKIFGIDLFYANNSALAIRNKGEMNLTQEKIEDENITKTTLIVPHSGLYKIRFVANINLMNQEEGASGNSSGPSNIPYKFITPKDGNRYDNTMKNRRYEVKLIRNGMPKLRHDNVFYRDNIDQDVNNREEGYFPESKAVNFIDPKQNKNILCGFAWGYNSSKTQYLNPLDDEAHCNLMALTGGASWQTDEYPDYMGYSATESKGYKQKVGNEWVYTDKFRIPFENIPSNYQNKIVRNENNLNGSGTISQIVWLEAGDQISVYATSDEGQIGTSTYSYGWVRHGITFDLIMTPFKPNKNWLQVNEKGSYPDGVSLDWSTPSAYNIDRINLANFLPSETKINEWVENFCKAFNLNLIQTDEKRFELNTKNLRSLDNMSDIINIDNRASIRQRTNTPLGLPPSYELGFKVEKDEQGYVLASKNTDGFYTTVDGKGVFTTKSYNDTPLTMDSDFSYNWYLPMLFLSGKIPVPIISDKEVWENGVEDYEEMQKNRYTNLKQRFWYHTSNTFQVEINAYSVDTALVSNSYNGISKQILDYENKPYSIMKNYFLLLADADNHYTTIECYLTPGEYSNIDNSLIQFNGDLYYVAEADGYDPMGKKKTTLKLIRKTL